MPVLVIDKPQGLSSFAAVKAVARHVRAFRAAGGLGMPDPKRIGHGGTLDPLATGVLPICIAEATKLAAFLLDAHKAYEATLKLGVETDTLDAEGEVVRQAPVGPLNEAQLEAAIGGFRGAISQVPPMYSALKRDGKPLYAYAREGQELEREPRQVHIFAFRLVAFEPPDVVRVFVECSKGTYIRVLAADLGQALGVGAHLTALRRVMSGPFSLAQALTLEELGARCQKPEQALPSVTLSDALAQLPALNLSQVQTDRVAQGQRFPWSELDPQNLHAREAVRLLRGDGSLAAVARCSAEGLLALQRVFHREEGERL